MLGVQSLGIVAVVASLLLQPRLVLACEDGKDCMSCQAMDDPASYLEGSMKMAAKLTAGRDHWLFRSEVDFSDQFGMDSAMEGEFARLVDAFAGQGTQLVMVLQPTRGLMHHDKVREDKTQGFNYPLAQANLERFLAQLRAAGAIVPDVMTLVETPPQDDYFFRRDHHWTPAGARVTARVVADELLKSGVVSQLDKTEYRTEEGRVIPKDGVLNLALQSLCGNRYSMQYVQGFRTVPVATDADALFGESATPDLALVGTSNSAVRDDEVKEYNFDGFLKEYLSLDILNFALPGSGEYGSLLQYLYSDNYSPESAPKLLLWELPANYTLSDELMYRQLIPAIKSKGSDRPPLIERRLEGRAVEVGQRIELLSNSGNSRIGLPPKGSYLDIQIADPALKEFYIIVYYDDGSRDKVWIRREMIVSGGQYFLELSRAPEFRKANLLSVFLEPTQGLAEPTDIEVRLYP